MRIVVSAVAFATALMIIFGNYPDDYTRWAFASMVVIVGHWLR